MAHLPPGFHLPPSPFPQLNVDKAWMSDLGWDPRNVRTRGQWGYAVEDPQYWSALSRYFATPMGQHAGLKYGFFGPRARQRI
jgi:hypothetical protein